MRMRFDFKVMDRLIQIVKVNNHEQTIKNNRT